jgi:hypothetical protein
MHGNNNVKFEKSPNLSLSKTFPYRLLLKARQQVGQLKNRISILSRGLPPNWPYCPWVPRSLLKPRSKETYKLHAYVCRNVSVEL